jgi:hypothetical protein
MRFVLISRRTHMTTIIAGRLEQQSQVQEAIDALRDAGFAENQISSFYVNPAGQHDQYALGGDHDKSTGAKHSDRGIAGGGAVGAAVGVATTPFLGPAGAAAGALVGAHIGSLVGSMSQMDEAEQSLAVRRSGMFIAVCVPEHEDERHAVDVLRSVGAQDLERADGNIIDGDWNDFDPTSTPAFLDPHPGLGENASGNAQRI